MRSGRGLFTPEREASGKVRSVATFLLLFAGVIALVVATPNVKDSEYTQVRLSAWAYDKCKI